MSDPIVYCYCYDHNAARGGQKDTYKHVDALNKLGIKAFAFHQNAGFRLTWFQNETPVVDNATFISNYREHRDIVVLPEDLGEKINAFPGYKVIYDKNVYYGFGSYGLRANVRYPALSNDVIGILSVSNHNVEHLRFAYPSIPVHRIWLEIDRAIFRQVQLAKKNLQFVYPRKAGGQIMTLVNMLRARMAVGINRLERSEWVMVNTFTESQTSSLLAKSICLVFLSSQEGLGLLPLEAIASGCLVTAYNSGPMRETVPLWYQFDYGNLVAVASFIESVIALYPDRLEHLQACADSSLGILEKFTSEQHRQSIKIAWEDLLNRLPR